jgi:cysteine-rich repeat protein
VCGNGVVEPTEVCDDGAGSPTPCPSTCSDGDACTSDVLENGGTCQAACVFDPIVPCCGNGVVDGTETCDTAIGAGQPGACPSSCNDGNACTTDTLKNPGTCDAACSTAPIVPCCGDGQVTSPQTLTETCDTAIPSGPGSCAAITCTDTYACTTDVPVTLGGNACRKICAHIPVNNASMADGCCPPQSRSTDDADCVCGDGTAQTPPAHAELCDDQNPTNTDACTNSCTLGDGVLGNVGAPCTMATDCNYANPTCITPDLAPPATSAVVGGYCSRVFCDPSTPATSVATCPQTAHEATLFGNAGLPDSICANVAADLPPVCLQVCFLGLGQAIGDEQCRRTEANAALGPAGTYAYRCTPTPTPGIGVCFPRDPTY